MLFAPTYQGLGYVSFIYLFKTYVIDSFFFLNYFSGHRGRRGGQRQWRPQIGERGKNVVEGLNENSPVIQSFRKFGAELDAKHDRYERLVKQSRDVTIESKRIIFLLHSIDKSVPNTQHTLMLMKVSSLIFSLF